MNSIQCATDLGDICRTNAVPEAHRIAAPYAFINCPVELRPFDVGHPVETTRRSTVEFLLAALTQSVMGVEERRGPSQGRKRAE